MDFADTPRENDLDGRGNLSLRALVVFVEWFLRVCLDQVRFMSSPFELNRLTERLRAYAERETDSREPGARLLEEAAIRGELELGYEPIDVGILSSDTPKGPVSLRFPLPIAERFFPRIFTGGPHDGTGFA